MFGLPLLYRATFVQARQQGERLSLQGDMVTSDIAIKEKYMHC